MHCAWRLLLHARHQLHQQIAQQAQPHAPLLVRGKIQEVEVVVVWSMVRSRVRKNTEVVGSGNRRISENRLIGVPKAVLKLALLLLLWPSCWN